MKAFLYAVALAVFLLLGGWLLLAIWLMWKLVEEQMRIGGWPFTPEPEPSAPYVFTDSDPAWPADLDAPWIESNTFRS